MTNRKLNVAALLTLDGVHDSPRSFSGPPAATGQRETSLASSMGGARR